MTRFAMIPVRGVLVGKTRLAGTFSPTERASIVSAMARHVIGTVERSGDIDDVIVVSARTDVLYDILAEYPAINVIEQPEHIAGLNPALDLGRAWARVREATGLAIIPADLPGLETGDIHALVAADTDMTIAPDRDGVGTNGLFLGSERAIETFAFRFGTDSASRHADGARSLGLSIRQVRSRGFERDLDTLEDWQTLSGPLRRHLLCGSLPTDLAMSSVDPSMMAKVECP